MRARASWRASSSRADVAVHADQHLLGDEQPVAQDLLLGEVEHRVEHRDERLGEVVVLLGDPLELLELGLQRLGHDLVEAVELGLEVVVERRGADADRRGDVGPLAVLVALAAELRRWPPRGSLRACSARTEPSGRCRWSDVVAARRWSSKVEVE